MRPLDGTSLTLINRRACQIYDQAEEDQDWKRARNAILILLLVETGMHLSKAIKMRVRAEESGFLAVGAARIELSTEFLERLHSYYEWMFHTEADLIIWKQRIFRDELTLRQAQRLVCEILEEAGYSWATAREIRNAVGRKWMREEGFESTVKKMGFTRAEYALRLAEKKR